MYVCVCLYIYLVYVKQFVYNKPYSIPKSYAPKLTPFLETLLARFQHEKKNQRALNLGLPYVSLKTLVV